ncbi:MAG: hypothetical protein QM628_00205 [Propionicimonas sp.]
MANPTTRWDYVPVWAVYLRPDDTPITGKVTFGFPQRVLRVDGRVIYAEGATVEAVIGDMAGQDSVVRAAVRQAWRDADHAADPEGFDGSAWDVRWDEVIVPAAIFARFPALDDPDIVHNPEALGAVTVREQLTSASGKQYAITPLLAQLDTPIPGINLGTIEVPPGSPSVPAPMYAKGVAGGVASLDETGRVPAVQLPEDIGGGVSSWDDLEDMPEVIAAGETAEEARAAIVAMADDWRPGIADVTGLTDALEEIETTPGPPGISAYQVAVASGFTGSQADWLASLVGPPGTDGADGADGENGEQGAPGTPGTITATIVYEDEADTRPTAALAFWIPADPGLSDPENAVEGDVVLRSVTGAVTALNGVTGLWQGTEAEYAAIVSPDPAVVYVVVAD